MNRLKALNNRFAIFKNNKRCVVFAIDSIIAILITVTCIIALLFMLRQISLRPWTDAGLASLTMDYLSVMEKDGTLSTAVATGVPTESTEFLNDYTSHNFCAKVTIRGRDSSILVFEQKTGCIDRKTSISVKRIFLRNDIIYYAEMEAWYRV